MTASTRSASRQTTPQPTEQHQSSDLQSSMRRSPLKVNDKPEEAHERPVREQLKKTSITGEKLTAETIMSHESNGTEVPQIDEKEDAPKDQNGGNDRSRRKRSFEAVKREHMDEAETEQLSKHSRKRSRDSDEPRSASLSGSNLSSDHEAEPSEVKGLHASAATSTAPTASTSSSKAERPSTPTSGKLIEPSGTTGMLASPHNKRTRDQFMEDHHEKGPKAGADEQKADDSGSKEEGKPAQPSGEPENKRTKDSPPPKSSTTDADLPKKEMSFGGFSNTSAQSPFSALSRSKSPFTETQTSPSVFKSSGFASFASTTQSPFASVKSGPANSDDSAANGSALGSGFGTAPAKLSFGSSSTNSSFAPTSGFASLGGGLGSKGFAGGSGASLKPFAPVAGTKKAKPVGSTVKPDDDNDGSEAEDGDQDAGGPSFEPDETDARFFEQEVETGEEDEDTVYSHRAKLYVMVDQQWKEKGIGNLKLNAKESLQVEGDKPTDKPKKTARFILRVDGSHRLALNSPVTKETNMRDPLSGPPKGTKAIFLGFEEGKPIMMQLKMKANVDVENLYKRVEELKGEM